MNTPDQNSPLDSAKLYDNLMSILDYDDKLAKMTPKELVLECLGSRAADYRCVNELMNRVLPNFTEVITDEETEAATTPSPERSQPLSLSEKKPECCTAPEWYEIQASAEHTSEPIDCSHLANTLAPYIKFSLFEPVPGEAHPFTAMSLEQIACLIQKNIDELMRPIQDELDQSQSVVMATRKASIDAMNRIRALCGKGPNDPLRAEDYVKEVVDQLATARRDTELNAILLGSDSTWPVESLLKALVIAETKLRDDGRDFDGWECIQTAASIANNRLLSVAGIKSNSE